MNSNNLLKFSRCQVFGIQIDLAAANSQHSNQYQTKQTKRNAHMVKGEGQTDEAASNYSADERQTRLACVHLVGLLSGFPFGVLALRPILVLGKAG